MKLFKELPTFYLKPVLRSKKMMVGKTMRDITGGADTNIVVWRQDCPQCKKLLPLLNQDQTKRWISINIDNTQTKQIVDTTEEFPNIKHYYVDVNNRDVLLNAFNIERVPFTDVVGNENVIFYDY